MTADSVRNLPANATFHESLGSLEGRMLRDLTEMIHLLHAVNRTTLELLLQQQQRAEVVIARARQAIAEAQQAAVRANGLAM